LRKLSAEEAALWAKVVATVEPLSREPLPKGEAPPPPVKRPKPIFRPAPAAEPGRLGPAPVADGTLDGSWDKRLRSGQVSPDRMIDLHGHRLDDAWHAIDRGLEAAIRSGERVVLLITGHAPKGDSPVARGKIRAAVNDWLGASRHADRIAAVRGAHPRHGGRGALYVILRRNRG